MYRIWNNIILKKSEIDLPFFSYYWLFHYCLDTKGTWYPRGSVTHKKAPLLESLLNEIVGLKTGNFIKLIQDGPFWNCSRIGGDRAKKAPSPKFIKHILQNTCSDSAQLTWRGSKNKQITWDTIRFLLTSEFFTENRQLFLYQDTQN